MIGVPQSAVANDWLEDKSPAEAALRGAVEDQARGRHVLDRHSQRLEDRDLGGGPSSGRAPAEDVAELARDVRRVDRALVDRDDEVACLRERPPARIDENALVAHVARVHSAPPQKARPY